MPAYTEVQIPYQNMGPGTVWVDSRSIFDVCSMRKNSDPSSDRQQHFADQLLRLSDHMGSRKVPIFILWPSVGYKRLDKGCIGHAVASGFLLPLEDSAEGYVTHVEIA